VEKPKRMKHFDPSYTPPEFSRDDFDGEKTLSWVKNSFTVQQVFGDDIMEKPCLEFLVWYLKSDWQMTEFDQYININTNEIISDEMLYQLYWSELNK
jgi:hypothetical protein